MIQSLTLSRSAQKALVCMLPVHIEQLLAKFRQLSNGGQATIHVCTRTSVQWNDSTKNGLVVTDNETTLYTRFLRSVTNNCRIGSATNEEVDCFHEHCLPSTGFAGECNDTIGKNQLEVLNYSKVFNSQFGEH